MEERPERQTAREPPLCYILCHVTSKFIMLTHCPQLLWKTRMNQINIEDALSDLAARLCSRWIRREERGEGNKQGATAYAIYLAVIDD